MSQTLPSQNVSLTSTLYETDFYAWTQEQAALLREGKVNQIDLENIAEEIDSLGKQERQELRHRLGILLAHLLKWEFQPSNRTKSWRITIRGQRREIRALLQENPSLKSYLSEAMQRGYAQGLDLAMLETNLDDQDFPAVCPYPFDEALNDEFFPG
jgi:hypothetical protein